MSTTKTHGRHGGRQPTQPRTERGRQLLSAIQGQNLTLYSAARKARLSFRALYAAIHGDPAKLSAHTIEALCGRLGLPLSLVAPKLAQFSAA